MFVSPGLRLRPALVNGDAGVVVTFNGAPVTVIGFTIADGKIVEIDARPSDSIVLSLQQKRPIYVARAVFEAVEDMTEILEQVRKQQAEDDTGEDVP